MIICSLLLVVFTRESMEIFLMGKANNVGVLRIKTTAKLKSL